MSNRRRIRDNIIRLLLLVLMFCAAIPTASALQGEELAGVCSDDKDKFKQGFCVGYLTGVSETLTGVLQTSGICVPKDLTFEKLITAVAAYSSSHEDKRRGPAVSLVWSALVDAWPCPGMKTPERSGGASKPK
jgi:Rap1a immunity proteins